MIMASQNTITFLRNFFDQRGINVSEEWLLACVEWCKENKEPNPIRKPFDLAEACYQQWLTTDLKTEGVQQAHKPQIEAQLKVITTQSVAEIKNNFSLAAQINFAIDIGGESAYAQLQKINRVKDENSRVSATNEQDKWMAAWQPKPKRMLKMELSTNATTKLVAIEHQPIPEMKSPVCPGLKVILKGPLMSRRGIIFLTSKNVKVLGGFVEEMNEDFSESKQLSLKLRNPVAGNQLRPKQYTPRGIPTKYRAGPRGNGQKRQSYPSNAKGIKKEKEELFSDFDDDSFFAKIEIPEVMPKAEQDTQDLFDDEDDALFAEIDLSGANVKNFPPKRSRRK